ncbi:MAG: type II toxin-antitoxin system VapC family toxin [Acidobacteria bacterium]|nr:type II toxin-antitoxin system VapC family toxin [Acidobacteriota bacterium]
MPATLVDSNVILDIVTEDPEWLEWSAAALAAQADAGPLVVNPLVYAEVAARFDRIEDLEAALPASYYQRQALPWEAAFLAGRTFIQYRRKGGQRRSPLPDFYIGAHALVGRMTLLTRDARRYRSYFPALRIVAP